VLVVLVALAIALFVFLRRRPEPAATGGPPEASPAQAAAPGAVRGKGMPGAKEPLSGDPIEDIRILENQKDIQRDWYTYPPWSRPRGEGIEHTVQLDPFLASGETYLLSNMTDEFYQLQLLLDKKLVDAGEVLTATLTPIYHDKNKDKKPMPANLMFQVAGEIQRFDWKTAPQVMAKDPDNGGWEKVGPPVTFTRRGETWVAVVNPTRYPGTDGIETRLKVNVKAGFTVPGPGEPNKAPLMAPPADTPNQPPPPPEGLPPPPEPMRRPVDDFGLGTLSADYIYLAKPAVRVIGVVDDRVVDGNLQLDLSVDLRFAGVLSVHVGLFAADGTTPVAGFTRTFALEAGPQTIPIIFFGKALRDVGIDGPYVLQYMRGDLKMQAMDDRRSLPWRYETVFRTKPHKATDFADREYQGPDKDEALSAFDKQIEQFRQMALDHGLTPPAAK
jgi:hypothetical protein